MKIFFDTSVLVAAAILNHEHHGPSILAFSRANRSCACCAAHNLAEFYATLTRYPGKERLSSQQALLALDVAEEKLAIIALEADEYLTTIRRLAGEGIMGATVYDGIIAACAVKAAVDVLYTWNTQHFMRLGPEISRIVKTP